MSADVTAAAVALLTAAFPAAPNLIPVFDTDIPGQPPTRYAVVYGDVGKRSIAAMDGASRDRNFVVQVTCVSDDPSECRRIMQGAQDALLDVTPAVDGLICSRFQHYDRRAPRRDESVPDRHVTFGVEMFSLYAFTS